MSKTTRLTCWALIVVILLCLALTIFAQTTRDAIPHMQQTQTAEAQP